MRNDPLEVWDWSESEWLRQNGVRRAPSSAYYAETRGGHGHPLLVSVTPSRQGWQLRLGPQVLGVPYTELRAALAALLALTAADSYKLPAR